MVPVKSHKPMPGAVAKVTGGDIPTLSKIWISEINHFFCLYMSYRLAMMGKGQVNCKS